MRRRLGKYRQPAHPLRLSGEEALALFKKVRRVIVDTERKVRAIAATRKLTQGACKVACALESWLTGEAKVASAFVLQLVSVFFGGHVPATEMLDMSTDLYHIGRCCPTATKPLEEHTPHYGLCNADQQVAHACSRAQAQQQVQLLAPAQCRLSAPVPLRPPHDGRPRQCKGDERVHAPAHGPLSGPEFPAPGPCRHMRSARARLRPSPSSGAKWRPS